MIIDKRNWLPRLHAGERCRLELGCGSRKRHAQAIGVDMLDADCVDLVGDVQEALAALPPGCADTIVSYHFLEHIEDTGALMRAMARVLAPGGRLECTVPHFSNPFYYSDPTHRRPFGLYSLSYFAQDDVLRRQVPKYGLQPAFALKQVRLVFKSLPPRYLRHALKKLVQWVFNATTWTQELYEECFSPLLPCYEIHFVLERLPDQTRPSC